MQEAMLTLSFFFYYCRFCPEFVTINRPLSILSNREIKFTSGQRKEKAIQRLKMLLLKALVITLPKLSDSKH